MKKIFKNNILPCLLAVILTSVLFFCTKGIPLFGLPSDEDIASVTVTNYGLGGITYTITDPEEIHLARNMANFLCYIPFSQSTAAASGENTISFTYHCKDGSSVTVAANRTTVFYRGKAHTLKGDNGPTFVNVAEGLFFLKDAVEANPSIT